MTKKLFFYSLNQMESHKLRLVNKEVIPKSFIRDFVEEDTKIKIIDNSYSINDLVLKDKNKKRTTKIIGKSLKVDNHILKHRLWHILQLNVPLIYNQKSINLTTNFVEKFSLFFKKKGVLTSILKAKKGGFSARSFGISGFLPLKEYKKLNLCKIAAKVNAKLKAYKNNKIKMNYSKAIWKFSKTEKLSLWQKTPFRANLRKWKFLTKNRPWFKKVKQRRKKKWKTKSGKKWLKKHKKRLKKRLRRKKRISPFIFYKNII